MLGTRPANGTASRILEIALGLAQTRGFNGFSYADIAAALGIRKASLHHHFPTKADLGRALLSRYTVDFSKALDDIDRTGGDAYARLKGYVRLYEEVMVRDRLCLCGMLAAEYSTLPKPMQQALRAFFDDNERWLTKLVKSGQQNGTLRTGPLPRDVARMLLSALEGAMLLARSFEDPDRFEAVLQPILADLRSGNTRKAARH
ncbi:MAG: TetR/AcrR family transcriptional regulator [Burkholderiales bacterium]|nr:TetR/AcrR family transcriptional regulator [Burkholderiales bacterium]